MQDVTKESSALDAFSLSRKVDPFGKRTMGVYTHCDNLPKENGDSLKSVSDVFERKLG